MRSRQLRTLSLFALALELHLLFVALPCGAADAAHVPAPAPTVAEASSAAVVRSEMKQNHGGTFQFARAVYTACELIQSTEYNKYRKAMQYLLYADEFAFNETAREGLLKALDILKRNTTAVDGVPGPAELAQLNTYLQNALVANRVVLNSSYLDEAKLLEKLIRVRFFGENYEKVKLTYEGISREKAITLLLAYLLDPRAAKYDPQVHALITGKNQDGTNAAYRVIFSLPPQLLEIPADGRSTVELVQTLENTYREIFGDAPIRPNVKFMDHSHVLITLEIWGMENAEAMDFWIRNVGGILHGNRYLTQLANLLIRLGTRLERSVVADATSRTGNAPVSGVLVSLGKEMRDKLAKGGPWESDAPKLMMQEQEMLAGRMTELMKDAGKSLDPHAVAGFSTQTQAFLEKYLRGKTLDDKIQIGKYPVEAKRFFLTDSPNEHAAVVSDLKASAGAPISDKTFHDLERKFEERRANAIEEFDYIKQSWSQTVVRMDETLNYLRQTDAAKVVRPSFITGHDVAKWEKKRLAYQDALKTQATNIIQDIERDAYSAARGGKFMIGWSEALKGYIIGLSLFHIGHGLSQIARAADPVAKTELTKIHLAKVLNDAIFWHPHGVELAVALDVGGGMMGAAFNKVFGTEIKVPTVEQSVFWLLDQSHETLIYRLKGTSSFEELRRYIESQVGLKPVYNFNGRFWTHDLAAFRTKIEKFRRGEITEEEILKERRRVQRELSSFASRYAAMLYMLADHSRNRQLVALGELEGSLANSLFEDRKSVLATAQSLLHILEKTLERPSPDATKGAEPASDAAPAGSAPVPPN